MLIVVLLPAPLGPSSPKISPLPMVKETPFTASILSKVLTRLSTCTSAGSPSFGRWMGPLLVGYDVDCSTIITPCSFTIDNIQVEGISSNPLIATGKPQQQARTASRAQRCVYPNVGNPIHCHSHHRHCRVPAQTVPFGSGRQQKMLRLPSPLSNSLRTFDAALWPLFHDRWHQ